MALIFRGVDLDQVLEVVIVDIVWRREIRSVSASASCRRTGILQTHMVPIVAQIALGMSARTSFLLECLLQTFLQGTMA